jgi:hypothetical protein
LAEPKLRALRAAGFSVHHDSVLLLQAAVNRLHWLEENNGAAGWRFFAGQVDRGKEQSLSV